MPNKEKPQDFELIELLIREAGLSVGDNPSTSTQQGSNFESFKARFQSYIDQIPSYLHSVGKEGFFPHFFLGSFSTLVDTEIAKKLNIKKIYLKFDDSKTLKVAVIRRGGITNQKSAIEKVNLFVISESDKPDSKSKKFTYDELEGILGGLNAPAQSQHVRDAKDDLKVKSIKIIKTTGEISVEVSDDKLVGSVSAKREFKEIKEGRWNKPEIDIAKLTNPDKEKVKGSIEKILKKIGEVHSKYKNSLIYGKEAREAAHHGFIAGALVNFRYRHNLRVYLEQFAGRGYTDIVLVPRGKDRSLNAIPIIIEMKAATTGELKELEKGGKIKENSKTTPAAALKQAEDYAKGFQPNVMRVLTTADDILCVGVNLDHPSPISDIIDKSRDQKITPLFNEILESVDKRNSGKIDEAKLKTTIQQSMERIYHTFPGTGEKGDNHYFSRFLLGQSLLLNEVKALESNFEKHVFIYGENIPTETCSEGRGRDIPQRQAAKEAGEKLAESNKLDESHAVVTMLFVPENDERLVYIMNIVEANGRAEVLKKGIPLDQLEQKVGNRKIVELNLNFNVKEKSNFEKYFSIEAKEPISLERYNNKKTDKFKGSFEKVPYPTEFKETFDAVLKSQLASGQDQYSSIGKYKELFGKLGEAVLPFKFLIEKEAHTQAVFHGAFSHYSDVKLGESKENRALVLTEFQTGRGKRIDMLVHGIKFADQANSAKEYTPIGLELKGPREGKNTDALIKEANDQINKEYTKGVTYKTLTDGKEVDFIGVVLNKEANSANSLILASKDEFTPVIVVHSSVDVIHSNQVTQSIDVANGEHLKGGQEITNKSKNIGIAKQNLSTLESATAEKDYHYWLQQHDIADIARIEYGYGTDGANTLFEVVGSPEHIANQLQQFQNSVTTRGERRPLTLIVNLNNNHWVTLVVSHQNGQYNGYYVDSLGSNVPDNIRQVLQKVQITVHDVSVVQQRDGYNCGLWALENARDINAVLQGGRSNIPNEIRNHLQVQGRNEGYFVRVREDVSEALSIDPQRIANLDEAILAEAQAPRKKFNLNSCVRPGGRSKRNVNPCLFSKSDVEKFSKGKIDENKVDKIIIDSEKFLTYVKGSQDEKKNAQLVEFVGDKSIEGDRKYLLDKVIRDQGYERYVQNERVKNLHGDISQQAGSSTKSSKLKSSLMNAAGGIQLIRGIHGAIVSCKDGTATDCGLNLGGIAWSFASQPIENVMVKITPKVVASAEKVVGKIPGVLGKQTKFAVRVVGVKFGSTIAKGIAGAATGVFDIVDIGMSASNLVDCKKRENSDNPCGEKEIRDNIASIAFSSTSFVSGVALTAASMPGVGIAVGFGLMVGYGIYSGVSNIVEYEKKYDTTHDENWRIFWHTFVFQPIPLDVQRLAARKEMVNSLTKGAWQALNNSPNSTVAYGIGLGRVSSNTLRPDYAKIFMNKKDTAYTKNLSRVIPHSIEGASRVCLPQVTDQDYEKEGTKNSFDFASYYCENSVVISHDNRLKAKQQDKTIVYDLSNVDKGTIIGSDEWNNNFLIDSGTAEITGGNQVVNRFVVNNIDFSGKIVGGSNSTNVLDLSELKKEKVIGINVNYRFKPNASGSLKARVNGRWLINDQIDDNSVFNYYYVGRKNKVDEILCMGYSEHFTGTDDREVIIDSGGGSNNNEKDVVENCKKVIISPYTTVKGGKSNYTFYVKAADYKVKDLYSEIDVDGTGTVVFPEIDLLSDCDQITYSTSSNTLSLKINLGQNNQFTLDIKNYAEQSSNKPHFVLIDKNGSNIVPKIERSNSSTIKITSFELHSEHSLDDFKDVENHYKKILNNNKDYKVLSVVRGKTQSQGSSIVPHMVFGSPGDDIINFDQGTMFARGGEGSDVYFISNDINSREVKIDNNSNDKKLDIIFMPVVEKDFSIQQCDLHLNYNNTDIQVKNYLQDSNYRHLIIMNKRGETFIPDIQLMSCSSSGKGKLIPFLQATQTQNMFLLSKDFQGDHVVIDSRLEDIEKYKDKDGLLLIRESENPFMIRIEGFYTDRSKWENISYSLWNNNDLVPSPGLLENVDNVMEYKDKLRNDYERIVKEYIEDFSNSTSSIQHNQKLGKNISNSVGQDEERIGVMVLKNITPDQVEVSSSGTDLIFRDKRSNHKINIKGWDNSESYRISKLEFDLGLEPIKILRLNRFSLSGVREIQNLIDKASQNYQSREEYTSRVEDDFRCLISIHSLMKKPTYQCSGFFSLQDQANFVESACSREQIEEFEDKMPSASQFMMLLEKLHNDLLLNGYNQDTIDKCSQVVTSGFGVLNLWINKAVDEDKWDEVQTLLDRTANRSNADVEHKNKCSKRWTLLNYFVYNGNVDLGKDIFKLILKKSGSIDALEDGNGWAALHYAVHYGDFNMARFLVGEGAKVDVKSKEGKTPLYLVIEEAKKNKLNMIQLFFGSGADIEAKDNDGKSPLYLITYSGDLGTIKLLFEMIKAKDNSSLKTIKEIDSLRRKIINQQSIPSNVKSFVDSYVGVVVQTVAKELRDNMSMHGCTAITEFGDEIYNFNKELFKEIIREFISVVYGKTLNSDGILECIDSYHHAEEKIYSYIALLDKMKSENHLSNSALFKLAYNVKKIIGSGEKYDLREIKNRLPGCVRNVVFPSKVCIRNVNFGEYLYPTDTKVTENRRVVATDSIGRVTWKIEFKDGKFYIISNESEHLYAADYAQYDDERRSVFTWIGGDQVRNDEWNIVPKGDICDLVNVGQREYLYSPVDYFKGKYSGWTIFSPHATWRPVFTWFGGSRVTNSEWKFEDCSRSRRKRNVEEFESEVSLGSHLFQVTKARENFNDTKILELSARLRNNLLLNSHSDESIVHWYSRPGNQEMLNKMMSSVLASVKEIIYPDQLNSRLDLDSCSKNNANSCPPLMRNIYNTINLDKKNVITDKKNVLEVTSGYERLDIENFPIQEKVINVNRKGNLKEILDLSKLVKQVDVDLGIKPIPMIVKEKNDLLIKLSISATGLKKDVMTVRIKDALINNSYKNLQIIFDSAPVEIDNNLTLIPSVLISDSKIIVVTPKNIEEGNKLIICREVEGYTFLHHKYDLIMTNALSANVSEKELYVMYFKDFYKEPKMKTLSIRFIDKEILLDDKINKIYNSDSIDKLNHANFTLDLQDRGINIKANDFHDNTVLKLAYCIKGVIDKTNNNVPPDLEKLKNKLPESLKNVVFASELCIRNVGYKNRYLYAADFGENPSLRHTKDGIQRQPVFLWAPGGKPTERGIQQSLWKFEPNGDNVYIVNVGYNGRYLYAADFEGNPSLRCTKDDTQRQPVFLWAPGGKPTERGIQQSLWKFEPNGDNVYIVNVGYNGRYLYAADFEGNPSLRRTKNDTQRQPVFLWAPGGKPTERGIKQGLWRVEDCSSTRKKRDTQELNSKVSLDSDSLEAIRARNKSNGSQILALPDRLGGHLLDGSNQTGVGEFVSQVANTKGNKEKPLQRKRRHHHGQLSRQPLSIDSSNKPEIAASSGIRPSSWISSCISWAKNLAASTFSIIPVLPAQYNIADKNNVKSDNKNIPQSTSSVGWNKFLNNENIALASCVADALDNTPSRRYQDLMSKGVEVVPSRRVTVEFALKKFNSFVEDKIRNLDSKEQARIRVELKNAYPEITASLERGVEFSGNVGLDNVLEKCKKCFCTNVLPKVSTCLSEIGVTKLGGNINR